MTTKQLFLQVAEGNERAFETLFNTFLPKLYPFIIKFIKSEPAAQEIVQETFIRVWLSRDKLSEIDNPGGWLYKVASNECYSYLRKSILNNKFFNPLTFEPEPVNSTHEGFALKELNRLIGEAVDKLPAQRKKIYRMSRDEGKSIPEIASILNISPNTVKNALVASLKFIREYLVKYGVIFILLLLTEKNKNIFIADSPKQSHALLINNTGEIK
ncbi:RNA polymerase sigma factor [Niastella sp. OAS944]|uniref:RNA polymerase sigma factor n=1 Tax=Niastella sp. OAS944 TaxID=2664089 RepID=UPI00346FFDC3|nr:RNA polymerase sigma-70 factor (ECF subfamily) [Chitinophagaceae bacterium OAS944]